MRGGLAVAALAVVAVGVIWASAGSEAVQPPPLGVDLHGDPLPAFARARLGRAALPYAMQGVAFLPDGQRVVCALDDGTWATLDLATGEYANVHQYHNPGDGAPGVGPRRRSLLDKIMGRSTTLSVENLHNVALAANGSRLAVARGASVFVHDVESGDVLVERRIRSGYAKNVVLGPNGRWLVLLEGGMGGSDLLIDVDGDLDDRRLDLTKSIGAAVTADGGLVAGVGSSFLLHDVEKEIDRISTDTLKFSRWGTALSADGTRAAYLRGKEVEVVMCDAVTGQELWTRSDLKTWRQVAFSPDGALLAVRNHVLDAATGETVHTIPSGAFGFSADGTRLAVGTPGNGVQVFDTRDWSQPFDLPKRGGHPKSVVKDIAFTADSSRVVTLTGLGALDEWDATDGRHLRHIDAKRDGFATALALSLSPEGERAIVLSRGTKTSDATLWGLADGAAIASTVGSVTGTYDVAFNGDEARLVTCEAEQDLVVVTIDPAGSSEVARLPGLGSKYAWTRFSPDGSMLWSRDATGMSLVRVADGSNVLPARFKANHADLSPDGEHIVAYTGMGLLAGPLADGAPEFELTVSDPSVGSSDIPMALSPGGRYLAVTAYTTRILELWAVGGRQRLARLDGHARAVKAMAFSPDGRTLATASNDGTVVLWDLTPFLDAEK